MYRFLINIFIAVNYDRAWIARVIGCGMAFTSCPPYFEHDFQGLMDYWSLCVLS